MFLSASVCVLWTVFVAATAAGVSGVHVPPPPQPRLYLLNASQYAAQLGSDLPWATVNAPFLDVDNADLLDAFYFRIRNYRMHIESTPLGAVITEFIIDVPWAGKYNTIPCAAGHHIAEGRWLHNRTILDDYSRFWFLPNGSGGDPRKYTFWAATAIARRAAVTGDWGLPVSLLGALEDNVRGWKADHWNDELQLFWQSDGADGGEDSIGGSGLRPTINGALYAEYRALAEICSVSGNKTCALAWANEASALQQRAMELLWNDDVAFFTVFKAGVTDGIAATPPEGDLRGSRRALQCPPAWPNNESVTVRELIGYTPWYFKMVPGAAAEWWEDDTGDTALDGTSYSVAWGHLASQQGFFGRWGPTTAERAAPCYNYSQHHECLWNAPSWPFATSRMLTAMGYLLNEYGGADGVVNASDAFQWLKTYAVSHTQSHPINGTTPWIGEDIHPDEGYWLAREILYSWNSTMRNRGHNYNHSTFMDLILSLLAGLRPSANGTLRVNPLVPAGALKYFAVDSVPVQGHIVTVLWDADGSRYGHGAGLAVWVDGANVAHRSDIGPLEVQLR